jgi:hypothetical protein
MTIAFLAIMTALLGVPYASIFEWTLHRYVMHRPVGRFRYAFNAHALTHHGLFGADETYHLRPSNVREKIPMAWWNGPVLILISSAPFYVIAMLMYFVFGLEGALSVAVTALILFSSYYGIYEYIHWCWHRPKNRRVEHLKVVKWLNGLHIIHHRYMAYNFNLVCPLADWMFGTYLARAKKPFAQVQGDCVPNVQPLSA